MEWFEHWFNSKEYLNVYKHRDDKDAEELVNLVLNNISLSNDSQLLDLAAGSGRHDILFAKRGFNVTAVDLSENLLSLAEENAISEHHQPVSHWFDRHRCDDRSLRQRSHNNLQQCPRL